MKILSKLMLAFLFVLAFSTSNAQNENNPWQIDLGINAVDFYPTGEDRPRVPGTTVNRESQNERLLFCKDM